METRLTKRELQIVQVLAWGASKKEVPDYLPGRAISVFTVDNTLRKVYRKLHIQSLNALSAWYFINFKCIGTDECPEPLKKKITAVTLFLLFMGSLLKNTITDLRNTSRTGRSVQRTVSRSRSGTRESTFYLDT